jgi:glycine cleavage system H protein
MNFPENLLYTRDHEWIRTETDYAYIGITDFAQKELGDIVYVDIETSGEKLKQHAVFGTVEAVKTVSDLFLPMSGEIIEVNPKIIANPELINKDPYGEGWLIKVKVENGEESTDLLYSAEYKSLFGIN